MSPTKQLLKDEFRPVPKADWQATMDKLAPASAVRTEISSEDTEKPFGILALAWMLLVTGVFLLLVGMARLTGQLGSTGAFAILAVGGVELISGIALAFGSHWAYRIMLSLVPANFFARIPIKMTVSGRPRKLVRSHRPDRSRTFLR